MSILWIALGGFCGAIARSSLALLITNNANTIIPAATLTINLLGSLGLTFTLTIFANRLHRLQLSQPIKLGVTTGFFGSFTTFSAISLETVQLLNYYGATWWLAYEFLNIGGGIATALLGYLLAKNIANKTANHPK